MGLGELIIIIIMIMIMKSLQGLDARFQSSIASLKQISILNILTNTSIYLLHSGNTRGKRSILYTPLHFAFAAFALTKTVTYDILINL